MSLYVEYRLESPPLFGNRGAFLQRQPGGDIKPSEILKPAAEVLGGVLGGVLALGGGRAGGEAQGLEGHEHDRPRVRASPAQTSGHPRGGVPEVAQDLVEEPAQLEGRAHRPPA